MRKTLGCVSTGFYATTLHSCDHFVSGRRVNGIAKVWKSSL